MDPGPLDAASTRFMSRIVVTRDVALTFLKHVPARLAHRSDDKDCKSSNSGNTCEKPMNPDTTTYIIVLATVIPVVATLSILLYLHRRNVKRQRIEDAKDRNLDLDFGLNEAPRGKKRRSMMFGGEKQLHKPSQLSMDMNLSSPYLLPPGIQGSHDSIHTLVRTFPNEQDPYRPVAQYTNSESGSVRSFSKDGGSMYGGMGNKRASVITGRSVGTFKMPPPRMNSLPRSPAGLDEKVDPFATPAVPQRAHQSPQELDARGPVAPIIPEIDSVAYPNDKHISGAVEMPDVQPPPRAFSRSPEDAMHGPPRTQTPQFELPAVPFDNIGKSNDGADSFNFLPERQPEPAGLGLNLDLPMPMSPTLGTPSYDEYGHQANHPQIQTSEYYEDDRVRSVEGHMELDHQQGGLGVPQPDNRRLSVGMRPLPPDEVTESEDPEYRANRIRSFYKEYFEDPSNAAPPMPGQGQGGYYEDYDSGYLGDAAYYDADSNAFVMPGAQPVTRRAMTPPPGGRRGPPGPGPRGPRRPRGPHGPHGSLGGMSLQGGPGGRPRAGSAFGPHGGYNSRAASSLGPRPDSSASGAWGKPKKNLPPPKALTTLPTPSKLRDDSFALMGAVDFAPPDSFREAARGRSQSPLGERRPYQPKVPVASPLVTAFDELAVLPSPHSLRKSSTFTGLDFAPPQKFKEADNMSDAGSIRSNRSGISTAQLTAIRSGAGRVSRLPGDTVFTQASVSNQLKPQWSMRP